VPIITEFIIPQNELDQMHTQVVLDNDYKNYKDDKKKSLAPILSDCLDKAVDNNKNNIYDFKIFFGEISKFIETNLQEDKNTKLEKTQMEIKNLFDKYQKAAKGCTKKCHFCKKKCDHPTTEKHDHHANIYGHQPRIFGGGKIVKHDKKKYASKITCDMIDAHREIKINGTKKKWHEIVHSGTNSDWKIRLGRTVSELSNEIEAYEALWSVHGTEICRHFGVDNDGNSIKDFIKIFNMNLRDVPSHYIVVVDESGSMSSNNNFGNAMNGANGFLNHLKGNIEQQICYISLILFNGSSRIIHQTIELNRIGSFSQSMRGGGTNFSPPLRDCIQSIRNNQNKADLTRIIFYTDGWAPYPENELTQIRNMIRSENMDVKLHWMTVDGVDKNDPNNIFNKSARFLGQTHCTIDDKVESIYTKQKFIEIFDNDDN
jgi:hypothetical protein